MKYAIQVNKTMKTLVIQVRAVVITVNTRQVCRLGNRSISWLVASLP